MSEKNPHEQDLEWLREIAAGVHAENALTEKYFEPLGTFFKKNARPKDQAEDLRQELLREIILSARADKIKIKEKTFSAYLYGAAYNKVYKSRESDDRHRRRHTMLETGGPALDKADVEKSVQDKITLAELLAKLEPPEPEILFDYYVARLTAEEIKEKYGYDNAAAARKDIERMRKRAKE